MGSMIFCDKSLKLYKKRLNSTPTPHPMLTPPPNFFLATSLTKVTHQEFAVLLFYFSEIMDSIGIPGSSILIAANSHMRLAIF